MEGTLNSYFGVLSENIWPKVENGGRGIRIYKRDNDYQISLKVFDPDLCIPVHIHPYSDQMVHMVEGSVTFVTKNGEQNVVSGESIIVRAKQAHGMTTQSNGARFITVSVGEKTHKCKKQLPDYLCQKLNQLRHDEEKLKELTVKSSDGGLYKILEHQSVQLAANRMLRSFRENNTIPFTLLHKNKTNPVELTAWRTGSNVHLLLAGVTMFSVVYTKDDTGMDTIRTHRIRIDPFSNKSNPKVPVLK